MNNLKTIMEKRDCPIKELAEHLGMTRQGLERYITGRAYPNVMLALKIADYLNTDISEIWDYKDIPAPDV